MWRKRIALFSLLVFLSIFGLYLGHARAKVNHVDLELEPDEMAMTFFDLSDGEACLLQNEDETVLINTGGPNSYQTLIEQLKIYNVVSINTLILTNHEKDYMGNTTRLVKQFRVSKILTSEPIKEDVLRPDFPLSLFNVWNSAKPVKLMSHLIVQKQSESTNGDLNVFLTYGNNSLLYLGNQKEFEKSMTKKENLVKARIVKLGSFGSQIFHNKETLTNLDPEVAILFKKEGVEFNDALLKQLSEKMIETFNLGQVGNVTIKFSPENYEAMTLNTATD